MSNQSISTKSAVFTILALMATACTENSLNTKDHSTTYVENDIDVGNGMLTPEILWKLKMVGMPSLSPDGQSILCGLTSTDIAENKSKTNIYIAPTTGEGASKIISVSDKRNISNPVFTPQGLVAYMRPSRTRDNKGHTVEVNQLYVCRPDGTGKHKLTDDPRGIEGFKFSPDGSRMMRMVICSEDCLAIKSASA